MKEFINITKVKDAKSLTFILNEDNACFNNLLLKEFILLLKKEKVFRVLLHTSIKDTLHNMVIAMDKSKFIYPHKHTKAESYQIITGELLLIYFYPDGKIKKYIKLSIYDTLIARVDRDCYHAIIPLSDYAIFHEIRTGPFESKNDSIFENWVNDDKDIYMNKLLKKYKGII